MEGKFKPTGRGPQPSVEQRLKARAEKSRGEVEDINALLKVAPLLGPSKSIQDIGDEIKKGVVVARAAGMTIERAGVNDFGGNYTKMRRNLAKIMMLIANGLKAHYRRLSRLLDEAAGRGLLDVVDRRYLSGKQPDVPGLADAFDAVYNDRTGIYSVAKEMIEEEHKGAFLLIPPPRWSKRVALVKAQAVRYGVVMQAMLASLPYKEVKVSEAGAEEEAKPSGAAAAQKGKSKIPPSAPLKALFSAGDVKIIAEATSMPEKKIKKLVVAGINEKTFPDLATVDANLKDAVQRLDARKTSDEFIRLQSLYFVLNNELMKWAEAAFLVNKDVQQFAKAYAIQQAKAMGKLTGAEMEENAEMLRIIESVYF